MRWTHSVEQPVFDQTVENIAEGIWMGIKHKEPRLIGWLSAVYRPVLRTAVKTPKLMMGIAHMVFLGSLTLFPFLGSDFVPTRREGTFQIRSTLPPGAGLDSAISYSKRIQEVLGDFPEITGSYARVGRAEIGGDPEPVNVVATMVIQKPLGESTDTRFDLVRKVIQPLF